MIYIAGRFRGSLNKRMLYFSNRAIKTSKQRHGKFSNSEREFSMYFVSLNPNFHIYWHQAGSTKFLLHPYTMQKSHISSHNFKTCQLGHSFKFFGLVFWIFRRRADWNPRFPVEVAEPGMVLADRMWHDQRSKQQFRQEI